MNQMEQPTNKVQLHFYGNVVLFENDLELLAFEKGLHEVDQELAELFLTLPEIKKPDEPPPQIGIAENKRICSRKSLQKRKDLIEQATNNRIHDKVLQVILSNMDGPNQERYVKAITKTSKEFWIEVSGIINSLDWYEKQSACVELAHILANAGESLPSITQKEKIRIQNNIATKAKVLIQAISKDAAAKELLLSGLLHKLQKTDSCDKKLCDRTTDLLNRLQSTNDPKTGISMAHILVFSGITVTDLLKALVNMFDSDINCGPVYSSDEVKHDTVKLNKNENLMPRGFAIELYYWFGRYNPGQNYPEKLIVSLVNIYFPEVSEKEYKRQAKKAAQKLLESDSLS